MANHNEARQGDQLHAVGEPKSARNTCNTSHRSLEIIHGYLTENCKEFKDLKLLREQVSNYYPWSDSDRYRHLTVEHQAESNPLAIQYYKQQCHKADNADDKKQKFLYKMMQPIAEEMNGMTGAFTIDRPSVRRSWTCAWLLADSLARSNN